MTKPSVLVVDDDPITLEVARERLSGAGFDVHLRTEALGTSRWITEFRPDVVLLDVMMPAIGGGELAGLLRRHQSVRVLLHSSKSPEELAELVVKSGADGAIHKTSDDQAFLREFVRLAALPRRGE